jgi:hypothetical protein
MKAGGSGEGKDRRTKDRRRSMERDTERAMTLEATTRPPAMAEGETEYLDLDRDGLLDAVHRHSAVAYHLDGDATEALDELAVGIGDDGVPAAIALTDAVALDVDGDGDVDVIEVTQSLVGSLQPAGHGAAG